MPISEAVGEAQGGASLVEVVRGLARDMADQWSQKCQQFLDKEREQILRREPTAEEWRGYEAAVGLLLVFGRSIYKTVADPLFPDRGIADEIHGRLIQLEHSWRLAHRTMSDAEAGQLMKEVFPGDPLAEELFPNAV